MKLPFDKIYCLHLVEAKDRYDSVLEECDKINLENEISFWYTSKKPINATIGNNIQSLHDKYYDKFAIKNEYTYGACFDCAYNHYSIIKQAYIRGLNNILIIEDDIFFNNNTDILKDIIDNIPYNYDVLKLYNTSIRDVLKQPNVSMFCDYLYTFKNYFELLNKNNYKHFYHSTLCYALSRKGMKALIDEYETNLVAADIALNNIRLNKEINFYTLKSNVFCMPKKFSSNIIK